MISYLRGTRPGSLVNSLRLYEMAILDAAWRKGGGHNGARATESLDSIKQKRSDEVVVTQRVINVHNKPGKPLYEAIIVSVGETVENRAGDYRAHDRVLIDRKVGGVVPEDDAGNYVYDYEDILCRL